MRDSRWALILAGAFLILAGISRFYRLDWSFSGDETSTFAEVRSLSEKPFFSSDLETYDRLPRAHPVAYVLQIGTYRLFGQSEAGARTGAAIAGTLSIAAIVLLTCLLFGRTSAVFVGVLLVMWPWHILHSQTNRLYSYAFLFGSLAMLTGALAWARNRFAWGAISGVASALAISSHNLTVVVPVSLCAYTILSLFTSKAPFPRRAAAGYAFVGFPLIISACTLGVLAMRGWSGDVGPGYGTVHTLQGLFYNLTWGVSLLALVGWLLAWRSGSQPLRMIAVIAAITMGMCVFLPAVASFRHDYAFAVSASFVLLASHALTEAYHLLRAHSRVLAWGIVGTLLLLPLPSLASYYQDGDRKDYRAAATYIKDHWQEGDLVAADSPGPLGYYMPVDVKPAHRPSTEPKACIEALESLARTGKRIWYVCRYAREEPPQWADQWLWQNAVRMLRIKKQRFDYHENVMDVYLLQSGPDRKRGDAHYEEDLLRKTDGGGPQKATAE